MNNLKLKLIQDVNGRTWQVYINRKTSKRPCMHKNVHQKKKINWKNIFWWRRSGWGWFSNRCFNWALSLAHWRQSSRHQIENHAQIITIGPIYINNRGLNHGAAKLDMQKIITEREKARMIQLVFVICIGTGLIKIFFYKISLFRDSLLEAFVSMVYETP